LNVAVPSVFFYISGHGFGHASRQIAIINALGERAAVDIVVRTSAPAWLLHDTVRVPFTLSHQQVDTGVVQIDSLHLDEGETIERAAAFHSTLQERARAEAAMLRAHDARLVVSDAPPLACAAALASGVPSVVCSNFTWDWIYEGYQDGSRVAARLITAIRDAYRHADAGWRLPMHGGFETITSIVDVPFVAHRAHLSREEVRRRLGLPAGRLVLLSFGGYGLNGLDVARLDCLDRYGIVVTGPHAAPLAPSPGVHVVNVPYAEGLRYEDLVGAVDVVATKPGYGIISECVANQTAMLYTSRGRFAEYDVLVAEMPRYLRCRFLDHDALFAGRWGAVLDDLVAASAPPERPRIDGAEVVANMIVELVRTR
jgi:L-arabinokinase